MSAETRHSRQDTTRVQIAAASVPGTLPELCDKLLSLIASYPEACSRGVRRMTASQDSLKRLAVALGAIGFEYSRQLFPWITDLQWFMMESHAAQSVRAGSGSQTVLAVFTELLAESMDDGAESGRDPFDFLNDLDTARLAAVVRGESPSALALLAAYWGPTEVSRILRVVPEATRVQAILQIARLQRIPEAEARRSACRFADHLRLKSEAAQKAPRPVVRPATRAMQAIAYPPPPPLSPPPGMGSAPIVRQSAAPARATPPPPPVPRLTSGATSEDLGSAKAEEALLSSLRAESPELYLELAQGDYFKAVPATRRPS